MTYLIKGLKINLFSISMSANACQIFACPCLGVDSVIRPLGQKKLTNVAKQKERALKSPMSQKGGYTPRMALKILPNFCGSSSVLQAITLSSPNISSR
jgi:hypothetical protein